MGVCCVVFDIDGILLEFVMIFLNIEKNKILRFCFQDFMFSSRFMLFPKKISGRGAIFLENQFFLISFHVLCYFQHLKKILKSAPSLTG